MKTFKCDLCGVVFKNKYTSHIKFYNRNGRNMDMCEYDICPDCFNVLRDTLWGLCGRVLTNIATFDDKSITIPCGNNGTKIVFNIDVIKGDDKNE